MTKNISLFKLFHIWKKILFTFLLKINSSFLFNKKNLRPSLNFLFVKQFLRLLFLLFFFSFFFISLGSLQIYFRKKEKFWAHNASKTKYEYLITIGGGWEYWNKYGLGCGYGVESFRNLYMTRKRDEWKK